MAAPRATYDLVFRNFTRARSSVPYRATTDRVFRSVLPFLKIPKGKVVDVSVSIVGTQRMRTLNREWRKVDKPTDVLAFPLLQASAKGYTHILLGDVFVCPEVVRAKATESGNTYRHQLQWTLVHGFLHLAGYDHERSSREATRMATVEQKVLRTLTS